MKLLSIDVGVKNLAYCLFTINDKDSYTIDAWNVVNLCNEEKKQCNSMNSKKNNAPDDVNIIRIMNIIVKFMPKTNNIEFQPKICCVIQNLN